MHPENQGIANQQSLASRQTVGLAYFEDQQRAASEQYQRELVAKRQCDDEAFRKICNDMDDFWKSPTGIACEIMTLLVPAMPFLMLAGIVIIAMNAASSR